MKCLSLDKSSGLIGLTSNFFLLSFLKSTQGFVSPSREENSGNTNSYNYHEAEDIYTYANAWKKNPKLINILYPLTLLNNNYKMLSHVKSFMQID